MIQVSAQPLAIDDCLPVLQAIEVGTVRAVVEPVGFFGSDAWTGVFDDAGTFANRRGGKHASRMNARGPNDQSHTTNFARPRGLKEDEKIFRGKACGYGSYTEVP